MAPIKLEDNIREKLEARALKPSADAWKKLEVKLEASQPKKKKVQWYYVAASFVGFLILASTFFNKNSVEVNTEIVNETIDKQLLKTPSEIISNNTETVEIAAEEKNKPKIESDNSDEKEHVYKVPPQGKSEIDKKIKNASPLAKVSTEEAKKPVVEETRSLSAEEILINTKIDEVVASAKKLKENNQEVSVAEVELLLNNARREIQTQRILNSPKVDATALLQDVEWELEKSFRDKVFDALGESFNKIRTAVLERNN
ncbi:hypothetical protein [Aequorivita sp. Q41]|uniref:hypothetical protein n=1 Tax=Aequorivita sp. Q41 TaxID=3153300 RepID=UPI003241F447